MTDINEAIADRAALGARIAEAMGLTDGTWGNWEHLVTWDGYGRVDAWMREQGWNRATFHDKDGCIVAYNKGRGARIMGRHKLWNDHDEPYAAIRAALKALEISDDTDD